MALPFLISSFIIPVIGMFTDKYGQRTVLLALSCIVGIITYILFIVMNPILPLIFFGKTNLIKHNRFNIFYFCSCNMAFNINDCE
jgi:Mg2+/citrate symporter